MSFRDALTSRLAKQVFDCWLALRADGKVPKKDLLCPLGLPPASLPYLMLMERMADGEFRCRLIGDEIREWYGENVVGRSLREMIPPAAYEARLPLLRHCMEEAAPAWFVASMILKGEPLRRGSRLLLPVAFRGDAPDGVLLIAFMNEKMPGQRLPDASLSLDLALACPRSELS